MRFAKLLGRALAHLALRAAALVLIGWGVLYWVTGDPNPYQTRTDNLLRAQDALTRAGQAIGR
ncbi:MAG TPA: hypothetical protein VIL65_08205 [Beijerinckiaceae bacterium]|jgi:hypothetical protein